MKLLIVGKDKVFNKDGQINVKKAKIFLKAVGMVWQISDKMGQK
ncbi:MAG TPA: hypothetical protein VIG33_07805 [Pseudobdellovibrionaceae bacterium]